MVFTSYQPSKERKSYARTTELDICGKMANIVIRALDKLPPDIEQRSNEIFASHADHLGNGIYGFTTIVDPNKTYLDVTRVLINYYIPLSGPLPEELGETETVYATWTSLVSKIGWAVNQKFPNLNHQESSFNIHLEDHHYHVELDRYIYSP